MSAKQVGKKIDIKKKTIDKKLIVKEICDAAKLYKENLVGKKFIYVFDGRYIEVLFKRKNYRHLTGVECNMSAEDFYKNALKNRLRANQIYFSKNHPYDLCKKKLKHLTDVSNLATGESFMLEEIVTSTKTYKFGTTDLDFSLCMDREYDHQGNAVGECYIVESLRDGDEISKSKAAYEVTHILSKSNTAAKYTDVLFVDKDETLNTLPADVLLMIDESLLKTPLRTTMLKMENKLKA